MNFVMCNLLLESYDFPERLMRILRVKENKGMESEDDSTQKDSVEQ